MEEIKVITDDWMRVRLQTEPLWDKSTVFWKAYLLAPVPLSMLGLYCGIPTASEDPGRMVLELGTPRLTFPLRDWELEGTAAA